MFNPTSNSNSNSNSKPAPYSIKNTLNTFGISIDNVASDILVNDTRFINNKNTKSSAIFCAVIGSQQDGRHYIQQAITQGAVMVIAECEDKTQHGNITFSAAENGNKIPVVEFFQLNHHLFALCQAYYQKPQQNMSVIGVTGTNGKTSTCLLIAKLLSACQPHQARKSAVIGTVGAGIVSAGKVEEGNGNSSKLTPINNTTPGATELHQYFAQFQASNVKNVAMEVSSHALVQRRITAEFLNIAVFTNLSRDHLDYHQSMAAYADAKKAIFTGNNNQLAIVNGDDAQAKKWLQDWPPAQNCMVYGKSAAISQHAYFVQANNISHTHSGVTFELATHLGTVTINSPLLGDFNIDNLLAAISVAISGSTLAQISDKKITLADIAKAVSTLSPIIGRMESFTSNNSKYDLPTAIVDYAHTPDGLSKALCAARLHCQGDLWVVFGCGGDRDVGKRPEMGLIAEEMADHVIITNDNPRHESAELIAKNILAGCKKPEKITVMLNRQEAVISALSKAKAQDIVLLAGKGHEEYTLIGDKKVAYNERATVQAFFNSDVLKNKNKNKNKDKNKEMGKAS